MMQRVAGTQNNRRLENTEKGRDTGGTSQRKMETRCRSGGWRRIAGDVR